MLTRTNPNHKEDGFRELEEWRNRLAVQDIPVLAETVRKIDLIAATRDSHAAELARVVVQDPGMSARVLKMANSAYYMGGRKSVLGTSAAVTTVNRAVMVLGFETIRGLCRGRAVLEELVQGFRRTHLLKRIAFSLHSALQARWLARRLHDEASEEIYLAALFSTLGEMALWSFADENRIIRLESTRQLPGYTPSLAEAEVLGFTQDQLTAGLARDWHLGPLLLEALNPAESANRRLFPVTWGQSLARAVESGWESQQVRQLIREAADRLHMTLKTAAQLVQANTRETIRAAAENGLAASGAVIPAPPETGDDPEALNGTDGPVEAGDPLYLRSNPLLQLQVLADITKWIYERRTDYAVFFSLVLEGLHRGVGLERVFFSLLTPDHSRLEVKYHLGWRRPDLGIFKPLDAIPLDRNIFSYTLEQKTPLWVKPDPEPYIRQLINSEMHPVIDRGPFFLMPILVRHKSIGLIYGDRQASGRELNLEKFLSFLQFCHLAAIGLSLTTQRDSTPG